MIRNYYTLTHIVKEINSLCGWVVDDVFTQDKDSLVISLNDGKRESFMIFVCDGKFDSFYHKNSFGKARKNAFSLLNDLTGEVFQGAEVIGKSRIIRLNFVHTTAYAVLFGGAKSNFLLVNSDGLILDAFKNKHQNISKIFAPESESNKEFDSFSPDTTLKHALANSSYLFGSTYSAELLRRTGKFDGSEKLADLSADDLSEIQNHAIGMINELTNATKFYLLSSSDSKKIMSPLLLNGYSEIGTYETCSEAVNRKIVSQIVESEFSVEYKRIFAYLDKQKRKIDKQIEFMQDIESAEHRLADYRKFAELLMSHPESRSKFGNAITLNDWENNQVEIKLDSKLNLVDNAAKYFDKARATVTDIKTRKQRLPEMLVKQRDIHKSVEDLKSVKSIKELERFDSNIKKVTGERTNTSKMTMEDKFRKFELGEGYVLYAGKNASNNDELTMKFAKPNDIWLHARGTSGSHTIIRMDSEEKPPKLILQKAAEITAYYSGARNAKYVPVIWTYKKYVRKPKGANVGAVVVAKETVIMAEPKLPE